MLITVTGWSPGAHAHRRSVLAFRALCEAALRHDIPLVITSPTQLFQKRRFSGWQCITENARIEWSKGAWTVPSDAVVYDAMYLRDLKVYRESYRRVLKTAARQRIPVFNPVLPAKDELYHFLTRRKFRGGRIPRTVTRVSPRRVLRMLDKTDKLWLKPVYGSGGRNIAFIQVVSPGRYMVTAERHRNKSIQKELGQQGLADFVRRLTRFRQYMAQEHIELMKTADNRKVDFRVTTQRSGSGAWEVTAITARMGAPGSVLTNFHAGGQVRSLTNLEFAEDSLTDLGIGEADVLQMQQLALRVSRRLQIQYPTLGILGLDIGHTPSGEFLVYDFNGRPGRDILTDDELVHYMDCVAGFAKYLSNRRKDGLPVT